MSAIKDLIELAKGLKQHATDREIFPHIMQVYDLAMKVKAENKQLTSEIKVLKAKYSELNQKHSDLKKQHSDLNQKYADFIDKQKLADDAKNSYITFNERFKIDKH